jgi:hypothetical protein
MFVKTNEYTQNENDIYFIQPISNKIIINDNYDGILILDNNLNLIKGLKIFKDITIYSSFPNNINEEIILFCPDNECMVHINLINYDYNVIFLKDGLEKLVFSNVYEWNMSGLVLSTYIGEFYSVSIHEKTIQRIDYKEIERGLTQLYVLHQESKKHKIFRIFPDEYLAIIGEKGRNINVVNYNDQTSHFFIDPTIDFIDIDFRKGIFAIVNEFEFEINTIHDRTLIYPEENFMFLQGRLLNKLNNIYLIVLSSSKLNNCYSKIDMFQLCS